MLLTGSINAQSLATVRQNDKWGAIDRQGNWVIQPEYDFLGEFSEGLVFAYIVDQFAGYIDKKGNRKINLYLSESAHGTCHNGFVIDCCPWRLIDSTGKRLKTESYSHFMGFSNALCVVNKGGKSYTSWFDDPDLELHDVARWEKRGGKWGAIDTSGKIVIPLIYDYPFQFEEEYAVIVQKKDEKYGFHYLDKNNNILNKEPFDFAMPFSEGLGLVNYGMGSKDFLLFGYGKGKWVYVDKQMKPVFKLPTGLKVAYGFSEGMALVAKVDSENQLIYGFMNKKGKIVIKPKYRRVDFFSENLALVGVNSLLGYINTKGRLVIPAKFADAGSFHQGLASVIQEGKWGFIDTEGKLVIPAVYDRVNDFCAP